MKMNQNLQGKKKNFEKNLDFVKKLRKIEKKALANERPTEQKRKIREKSFFSLKVQKNTTAANGKNE